MNGLLRDLQTFVGIPDSEGQKRFLNENPHLLDQAVDALLAEVIEGQRSEGAKDFLSSRRTLLAKCREIGVNEAFSQLKQEDPVPELVPVIGRLLKAATLQDAKAILEAHPELLDPSVDGFLQGADPRTQRVLSKYRDLLARCREVGIDAAFTEIN